jgi:peptidoglycan hydrolase-like protein with peptidoglycan-binding domain
LQSELKRVGCYGGVINGVWTGSTRQAMKAFMDRVNATLPTDLPDTILLTALIAQPKKEPPQSAPGLITDWTTKTTVAGAPLIDQGEGPMALAGPTADAPAALTASAPPLSAIRKPVVSPNRRFGAEVFRKLDRLGSY